MQHRQVTDPKLKSPPRPPRDEERAKELDISTGQTLVPSRFRGLQLVEELLCIPNLSRKYGGLYSRAQVGGSYRSMLFGPQRDCEVDEGF